MSRRMIFLLILGCCVVAAGAVPARNARRVLKGDVDQLLEGRAAGTRFRLVQAAEPDQGIESRFFWRRFSGAVAAETAPVRFRLGDTDVLTPQLNKDKLSDAQASYTYPTEGSAPIPSGRHLLEPGGIPIEFEGVTPTSKHPAIKIVGGEVRILCAPVRLEVVDGRGAPVPSPIRLGHEAGSLLREDAQFSVLIVWLPVGGTYASSFGTIVLDGAGRIDAGACRLARDVQVTETGLRKTVLPGPASRPTAPAAETVTLRTPTGTLEVFVPAVAPPGGRLWLGVSRKAFQEGAGRPLAPESIACVVEDGADGRPLRLQAGPGPEESQRAAAVAALATTADDLAWVFAALPDGAAGPTTLNLKLGQHGGAETAVLVADLGGLHLIPHRWRTVFADTETAVYNVLIPRGDPAGEAEVLLQDESAGGEPVVLGRLALPAVEHAAYDARLLAVNLADLPPGKYLVWLQAGSRRSGRVGLSIVSWLRRSPFFAHSMSGCTTCWPASDEGLEVLEKAGLEMLSATGHNSLLDTAMPRIDPFLAARLERLAGLPAETALRPTGNDRLLERLLQHRLRLIDLTVCRAYNFYNEGLSYHHSYPPSVDRMIRRMQIFTQQTGDYASFWGVNYAWFPVLGGYVEGGVATDAHTADRNRVLTERVREAGFSPLAQEDRRWLHKDRSPTDPNDRAKLVRLAQQAAGYWRASQELGWGRHNALYNAAVREVRPGTVCTLFENAGHNEAKRLRAMFRDMAAQCYESYTDFGDWPMSSAFVVDWSRGQSRGQPVWLTTCWGTSSEGKMKSLFHAFARGMEGGGVPMQGTFDLAELARRGTGTQLVAQYGALTAHAVPDNRVAILARTANLLVGRGMWDIHAAYCHLTRIGYPPVILADEDATAQGIPPHVKVLVLVKEQLPREPELRQTIEAFEKRGGKAVAVGACLDPPVNSIAAPGARRNLGERKGFHAASLAKLWEEVTATWRAALGAAMARTGLAPLALTDPERAVAVTMDAGAVRYVVVLADARGTHSNVFQPIEALPVSLEGTGWLVRDLVKQKTLPTTAKDGRTEVSVELLTEPTTILALYRAEPGELGIETTESPRLGEPIEFQVGVKASGAAGGPLGPVPVRCTLTGSQGAVRADVFRAAGDRVLLPLAARDRAGTWRLTVQELLTGRTASADLGVGPARALPATAQTIGEVHVVDGDHLRKFAARPGEKLVLVEPDQQHLMALARSLVEGLGRAGVQVRLWPLRPEDYDTHPLRWYPTAEDQKRLDEIAAGRLIGWRQDLKPYIDKLKRAHDPERGGYAEIDPPYMVGRDCIVFSGGRLCESLRAVSPWMGSPNVPGKGQGRLVVCFSSFMADRHALAVVANDEEGFAKAIGELVRRFAERKTELTEHAAAQTARGVLTPRPTTKAESRPVAQPYVNYTPVRRVLRLLSRRDGSAAMLLRGDKDNLAMIDTRGKLTSLFTVDPLLGVHGRLDDRGRLLWPSRRVVRVHPGWGFPTEVAISWQCIAPDAVVVSELSAYSGPTVTRGFESGVVLAGNGEAGVLGRPGGLLYRFGGSAWRRYDDVPFTQQRFEVLCPRQPVGAAFSPDGRFAVFTMDSRPPFGGMNQPMPRPSGCETVLLDLQTGQRLWALRTTGDRQSTYAVHSGFAAVARDGTLTALADFDGAVHLVDRAGKVVASQEVTVSPKDTRGRIGPPEGVATRISDGGETAVFAFSRALVIGRQQRLVRAPVEGALVSADVSADGQRVVVGLDDGRVVAMDPSGQTLWTVAPGGAAALVAAINAGHTLAAMGSGDLVRLDPQGKEVGRTRLAEPGQRSWALKDAPGLVRSAPPLEYVEPSTLAVAKERLAAKQVAAWTPSAPGHEAFGRSFHTMEGRAELSADGPGDWLAHLVYRRPAGNQSLSVETGGADGPESFWLDLPTPEYRVVDLPLRGPLRGPKARVAVVTQGPVELAELSLWSLRWPGSNVAHVKPVGVESAGKPTSEGVAGDLLRELEGKAGMVAGKIRDCRIWWPNTDVDAVRGPWLPAPIDPMQMIDGKRFGNGKLGAWADRSGNFLPIRGGFCTIDFGREVAPSLLAFYDRANRQSAVAVNLAVFTPDEKDALRGGRVLGGAVGSDQFWRLMPLGSAQVQTLGVHVIREPDGGVGLSEIEVYP